MIDAPRRLPQVGHDRLQEASQPDCVDPMLAKLTERRFSEHDWIVRE